MIAQGLPAAFYCDISRRLQSFCAFYRATLYWRGMCCRRVSVCLSVCLSVKGRSSTKWAKRRITQTTPYDSSMTLVLCYKDFDETPTGSPQRGAK